MSEPRRKRPAPRLGDEENLSVALAVALARDGAAAPEIASELLRRAGLDPSDVQRALRYALTPPEALAEQERRAGAVLAALRTPGVAVEEVEVLDALVDETHQERRERARDAGWFDAVLAQPVREMRPEEQGAYDRGRRAFERIIAVFRLAQDALRVAAAAS